MKPVVILMYLVIAVVIGFIVGLSRLRKFLPNQNFAQSCSKKTHLLFVWCLKSKINEF